MTTTAPGLFGRTSTARVVEPSPYSFTGRPGSHEFSGDVLAFARGDGQAGTRLNAFIREAFAVTRADAVATARTGSATYLPESPYVTPLWSAIAKPAPFAGPEPFLVPTYATGSNLVDDTRAEGTEPAAAAITTGGPAVNATSVMGHVDLSRELSDQREGNPTLSAALWGEMRRSYDEALEARAAAALAAISSPTTIAVTAASTNATLVASLRSQLAPLAHIRGGAGMRAGFLHAALYQALVGAVDSAGQRLVPDAPTGDDEADGVVVLGRPLRAAWALPTVSWLLDARYVHGWATAPRELMLDRSKGRVSTTVLGLVGYALVHVARPTYVRKITY
ncbi:hypothetical protein [Kineosporia sp. R_H_3]|uniref:hypothetical protein n=1 Tax=Kineosporia sp. R_H_3 TaxID=1961848 RepID=UPI000B4A99CF|nr:hypothetical protein [Kineosporia sp. R_H_3]